MRRNKDVVGGGCVKGADGKIVVDEDKMMEIWRTHYEKLSNEEFPWNKETLTVADITDRPCEEITISEVQEAINKMKNGKAAGPSGVVAEMLKAAGEAGLRWVTDVCNKVVREGMIPVDWCKSWMVNVYKGKGDALECGSYRGIRLLEHALKILERIVETRVRKIIKIDSMQFGFMEGRGTTDAIFIVRQLQEKFLAKKDLWMAFVDLEKDFDRVPREVLWWALRELGVEEGLVTVIKAMYADALTMVKLNGRVSKGFRVKVGVHQGSVLSPLLFIIVMEALSRKFR
jgi:Reverse transcriptase (RNA-dependent DNA polymerase)